MLLDTVKTSIVGHQNRFVALSQAAIEGRIPQTLLISGQPHIGKSTFARYFAQLLLCEAPISLGDSEVEAGYAPCEKCRACHQVKIGTHPDYSVLRPQISASASSAQTAPSDLISSIISVDQAREFSAKSQSKPIIGARKVMIIEQTDRMNSAAQNALLKTFEEPAEGLTIILLCDNANVLLPTVRSRCWEIRLGLVDDESIANWVRHLDTEISEEQLAAIVQASRGRPGWAWREWQRSKSDLEEDLKVSRLAQLHQWVNQFEGNMPVAALRFSDDAQKMAAQWWDEDMELEEETFQLKGTESKVTRSAIALFLDSLMAVYRARWREQTGGKNAATWAAGIDQIRQTRHYIIRNANVGLALDILFSRLLALRQVH